MHEALERNDGDLAGPAWPLLSRSGTTRFADALLDRDWSWSGNHNFWEDYHGSKALALARPKEPLEDIASRIAPAFLLRFLAERQGGRDDAELIADILTKALLQQGIQVEEPLAEIILDKERVERSHYAYTIGRSAEDIENEGDAFYAFAASSNPEAQAEKRSAAVNGAIEQVKKARESGAHLHLILMRPEDFDPIFKHCPDTIATWLHGIDEESEESIRRIQLAEGFYVAFCRKLLDIDPAKGASLWRLLRTKLFTRFIGAAGVDELVHMVFEANASLQVMKLRDELYSLEHAQTDEALIDLVIATRRAGCEDWIFAKIEADKRSPCPAHNIRAVFLEPLVSRPQIAEQTLWPTGQPLAGQESVKRASWKAAQHEAYSYHWLKMYAATTDPVEAHAAWRLVEASADPRARIWIGSVYDQFVARHPSDGNTFDARKRIFSGTRKRELHKAMEARVKNWKGHLGGRRICIHLLPWNN